MAKKRKKPEIKPLPKLAGNFPSFRKNREETLPVDELAKRARVSLSALAGMKTAYGWDSRTMLTEAEFGEKSGKWLNAGEK